MKIRSSSMSVAHGNKWPRRALPFCVERFARPANIRLRVEPPRTMIVQWQGHQVERLAMSVTPFRGLCRIRLHPKESAPRDQAA